MTGPWSIDPFVFNFDMYNFQGWETQNCVEFISFKFEP